MRLPQGERHRAGPVRPEVDRATLAGSLGKERPLPGGHAPRRPEEVRPRHAAVPVRRDAHGSCARLFDHGRARPLCAQARVRRLSPLRMGRLRSSSGERRHQGGRPPGGAHSPEHRVLQAGRRLAGHFRRLVHGDLHVRPRVLPLEPMVLPAHARARHRLPAARQGQLLPELQHGPRQRAGRGGPLLALRQCGRGAGNSGMGVADHRLRRPAPGGAEPHRLARARRGHAAQLDRPIRRSGDRFRHQGSAREGLPRLHDARRHHLRCHLRRGGAGPPPGRRTGTCGEEG